jgi:hypothetical protein
MRFFARAEEKAIFHEALCFGKLGQVALRRRSIDAETFAATARSIDR